MKTPKLIAPNTVLPEGGRLLARPQRRKVAGWVEMEYDATVERFGLTLLRVKGGMGEHGDREDWVADIPDGCLSVHDYQWREPRWGFERSNSFDEAVAAQVQVALRHSQERIAKLVCQLSQTEQAVRILTEAAARAK